MEVFKSLTWTPSLDDIIDDKFVNVDRLEKESAMYNIMLGTFVDPMKDIHNDFVSSITPEDIECVREQAVKTKQMMKQANALAEVESAPVMPATKQPYVPGVYKPSFKYPRPSALTIEQQALCLRIILNFSRNCKPENLTAATKEDLNTYMSLQKLINDEQEEFLQLAKQNWDPSNINIVREDLINLKWKAKLDRVARLPRYYTEAGTISFIRNQEVHLEYQATLLETGTLPRLILPTLVHRCIVQTNSSKIQMKYFSPHKLSMENNVSQDVDCERLLATNDVDLVISSAGLNCLATNLESTHKNTWILPIVVKEINGKNVVFVDKPLPPIAKNIIYKNSWIYKYILKNYVLHPSTMNLDNIGAEHLDTVPFDFDYDPTDDTGQTRESYEKHHVQYSLFNIGACGSVQNELLKDKIERDYKILVRTKVDAIEKLKGGKNMRVKVVPKLEHQITVASEAVTLDEAAKQWITLKFTPDTTLIRARIYINKSEFLQTERRTCMSINNEMKRLYSVRGEDTLPLIYNVIDTMKKVTPGRYLLRHSVQNGAFAMVYKEAPATKESCIDLQAIYCDTEYRTIPSAPWPLLDKTLPTPATAYFNRMPAMYFPSRVGRKNPVNKQTTTAKKCKKSPKKNTRASKKIKKEN